MADIKNLVKLAIDARKGNVEKYSVNQSMDVLREALIEANNGKTYLDYKDIRDGKCPGLFSLVEELLSATIVESLQEDALFNALVDFRNVAAGDEKVFIVEDAILYVVADIANGTQGIRRQRLANETEVEVPATMKAVRIYEELNRILAGRVDFNKFVDLVAASFRARLMKDIYTLWNNVTSADLGGAVYFPAAGAYDEDDLLDLIAHVEAAAGGKPATIIGTKKAVRHLAASIMSDSAKEDLYNMGYYGKFYGTPVVITPQRHEVGTTTFALDDDVLTIVAGDQKPIKVVYEGAPLIIPGNPVNNADLTQEYFYGDMYGVGLVIAGGNAGIGRYEMTT